MTMLLRGAEGVYSLEVRGRVIATMPILHYSFERPVEFAERTEQKEVQWGYEL